MMRKLLALPMVLFPLLASAQVQTDRYGNTTGRIGQAPVQMQHQGGLTTGRIGDTPIQAQTDRFGNTTGRIGNTPFIGQTDASGTTRGIAGGRQFTCTPNGIGGQTCR
ncbi:hypothetical protein [Roseococcus sp. YIM B11640]|uniref:hypothetical protein n=1 Tax=Roseococcus sp. YIM B11640 TaxID=3133973 RepID=UPI003C7D5053